MITKENILYRYTQVKLEELTKLLETYELKERGETIYGEGLDNLKATPGMLEVLNLNHTFFLKTNKLRRTKLIDIMIVRDELADEVDTTSDYMFMCLLNTSYGAKEWKYFKNAVYRTHKRYHGVDR